MMLPVRLIIALAGSIFCLHQKIIAAKMKKYILKLVQQITLYFIPKSIVISYHYPAGLFVKASDIKGKKYITIAVTNQAVKDEPNAAVIHHVPVANVVGIRKSTTPFEKWYYGKVLNKPCPKKIIKVLVD